MDLKIMLITIYILCSDWVQKLTAAKEKVSTTICCV